MIQEEQQQFARAVYNTSKIFSKDSIMQDIVNDSEILRKLLFLLQKSFSDIYDPNINRISQFIIQTLGDYIYIVDDGPETQALLEDMDDDEREDFIAEQKMEHQNVLNQHNAMLIILQELSHYNGNNHNPLFYSLLDFGIKLLDVFILF